MSKSAVMRSLSLLSSISVLACSSSSSPAADAGIVDSTPADKPGDPTILVGTFQVQLVAANADTGTPGYTALAGKVYDGPTPSSVIWEETVKEGDCRLLTPRVPFCSTPCGSSAACVEDETCQAYPVAQSVGTVQVHGLQTEAGAVDFSMDAILNGYQPSMTLAYPAFSEGDDIVVSAQGSSFTAAFSLTAQGIAPLNVFNDAITLSANQALTLSWSPPATAIGSKIHVKLDISHHGGTKGKIECDTSDTGTLVLPASLITPLLALGAAGFPTVVVARTASGSATISAGRVDLLITSEVEKAVAIPGVVSCNSDDDCPTGTCQPDLTCK